MLHSALFMTIYSLVISSQSSTLNHKDLGDYLEQRKLFVGNEEDFKHFSGKVIVKHRVARQEE